MDASADVRSETAQHKPSPGKARAWTPLEKRLRNGPEHTMRRLARGIFLRSTILLNVQHAIRAGQTSKISQA